MSTHLTYGHLKKLGSQDGALLLVGHGTRSPDGQTQLLALAQAMQIRCPEIPMQPCFLELAEPSIEAGLKLLAGRRIKRLLIVPILLFTAAHAQEDIPNAVADFSHSLGIEIAGQSSPLNLHHQALELSQVRYSEALLLDSNITASVNQTALVMIGRGTSQLAAREAMRAFVRLRCERYPIAWSTVGFFAGDAITVTDALDQAALQTSSNTVVVQPHLLFEGDLSKQLRSLVTEYQLKFSRKKWLLAEPLGSDERLSETYLSLADDAAAQYVR